MLNTNAIKAKIVKNGLTQEDCAKRLEIATPTFNQKINNIRPMSLEQAEKLSKLLEITDGEFASYFFA